MKEQSVNRIGWVASCIGVLMYFSYIDQIMRNLSGHPGSILLPATTILNCSCWILYGSAKPRKDWPIISCNIPGVVLGIITIITAI